MAATHKSRRSARTVCACRTGFEQPAQRFEIGLPVLGDIHGQPLANQQR